MHAIAAYIIAADHLRDLQREAQEERLRRLVDSVRPPRSGRVPGLGRRFAWGVRRLASAIRRRNSRPADGSRPQPAGA